LIDVPARLILSLAEVYVKRSKAIYASVAKRSNFLPNDLPKLTSVWRWPVCVSITDESIGPILFIDYSECTASPK